jgi:HPt (histidine-containing phosphotransfer) domain-containing protein
MVRFHGFDGGDKADVFPGVRGARRTGNRASRDSRRGHRSVDDDAVFRAVHSIKGGAGAFNLDELVHFAHVFESALDHLRAGRLVPSGDVLKTMLRAADMLADVVRAARDGVGTYVARRDVLVGETDITCDFSRLPALDELDPEGSYLNWTIELRGA